MFIFGLLISTSLGAVYGIDFCTLHSVSSLQCFIEAKFTFTIPRCWCSDASWDSDCYQSVANSHAAGMSRVDAYFFPCYSCGNVAGQVSTFWNKATGLGMSLNWIWFDIEGTFSVLLAQIIPNLTRKYFSLFKSTNSELFQRFDSIFNFGDFFVLLVLRSTHILWMF